MQVKNKLFPYPVINHNKAFSNFADKDFIFVFDGVEDEYSYTLKNARFETDSTLINSLFDEGKVGVSVIVECSDTVYRKSFSLSKIGNDIILPKINFSEKVDVSIFAYANEDIVLDSDEVDEDYQGIKFEIEKYDILGANDGFHVRFKHEEMEENLVQSIFSVGINHDLEDGMYTVECNIGRKIAITMSDNDYKNYKIIYTVPTYKEVFFNMLLVPSLIEGLSLCRIALENETKDLDDVGNQYLWFRAIQSAYKKLKGVDFTQDDFKKMSSVSLAQELLGKPLGESLKKLVTETNKTDDGGNAE